MKNDSVKPPQKTQQQGGRVQRGGRVQPTPQFSIEHGVKNREPYVDLILPPYKGWPIFSNPDPYLLARIFADRIETWPVGGNPHSRKRSYNPHDFMTYPRVVYRLPKPFAGPLPSDPSSAVAHVDRIFDSEYFHPCIKGLGFKFVLSRAVEALQMDKYVDTIEVHFRGEVARRGNVVCVSEETLEYLKRSFKNADCFWSGQVERSRDSFLYEEVVKKLVPDLSTSDVPRIHYYAKFEGAERDYLAKLQEYISQLPLGTPEHLKAMRESMDRGELYRMIYHYQTMLTRHLNADAWHTFLSHHMDWIIKCFQQPECGVLDPPLSGQLQTSPERPIICGQEALVLAVKAPGLPLMTRGALGNVGRTDGKTSGEPTEMWIPHSDLASAIEEGRKQLPDIRGQIQRPRCVILAGLLPNDAEEAAAYINYRKALQTYHKVHLVDYGTLLCGLYRLASLKGIDGFTAE